jgi:hypothetical protein
MNYTLLGVLMIGGPAVYAVAGVLASRRILHGRVQEGHNDVLVPIFLNAGVLFAVLLGFMVVAVWESYDAAKSNTATEAAALVPLYRATIALPKEAGDRMREISRDYVHQIIEDEWATQAATGQGSSKARKEMGNMFRAFGDGTISGQIKKDFPFICTVLMQSVNEVTNEEQAEHSSHRGGAHGDVVRHHGQCLRYRLHELHDLYGAPTAAHDHGGRDGLPHRFVAVQLLPVEPSVPRPHRH